MYKGKPDPKSFDWRNFWSYTSVLPKSKYRHFDVGGTKLAVDARHEGFYLKMEINNPTRSFKDRGSVIEIAKAAEYGYKEVVCASTGNMAYSVSYYAKLYGMKAKIFISDNASKDKIKDIRSVGDAIITKVNGDFNEAQDRAIRYSKSRKAFLAGDYGYRKEGQKIIAYEIIAAMPSVKTIIVPVGNATLLSGVFKAMEEMKRINMISKPPLVIGVEAAGCNPLEEAVKSREGVRYRKPRTAADAIAVGYPTFGGQALEYIDKYNGMVISVSDKEMKTEQKELYDSMGIIAELAAVAGIAAYKKLRKRIGEGPVVSILSGANV